MKAVIVGIEPEHIDFRTESGARGTLPVQPFVSQALTIGEWVNLELETRVQPPFSALTATQLSARSV